MTTQQAPDQTTIPGTENGAPPKKATPVHLRSAPDFEIVTRALDHESEELKKLSKRNSDAGYVKEARRIEADVYSIEHHIAPQFRSQRDLPVVTHEQLAKEVAAAVRLFVFRTFDGLDNPKVQTTPEGIRGRRDRLVNELAERITLYASDVSEGASNEGYAARLMNAESIALHSIGTLRGRDD